MTNDQNNVFLGTSHLIDVQPNLILGCSNSEIFSLVGIGFCIGLIIGLAFFSLLGFWYLAFPFSMLFTMMFSYYGAKKLGKTKEGRPTGYFDRLKSLKISKIKVAIGLSSSLVFRNGYWRIRR